jgi:Ca-activated chloride channel family protein
MFSGVAIVALSGPSWRQAPSPFFVDKAPLVIALDLSASMQLDDIQPTRLERAKHKIEDLLKERAGAPTGLIAYAGSAHTVIPLTNDPDIVINLLAAMSPEIMPTPGKQARNVLPLLDVLMTGSQAPGTLLLITDGIDNSTTNTFSSHFSNRTEQLIVWGIGSIESPLDMTTAFTPLQEEELKKLSIACNGHYQDLTINNTDAKRVQRLTVSHLVAAEDEFTPWVDDGYYLAIPMAFLILIWFRRGWTLSWE